MIHVTVYSSRTSPRLEYVLDWLLKEVLHASYNLVHDAAAVGDLPFFISYGTIFPNALSIPDAGLLWERGIKDHEPQTGIWGPVPTLYPADTLQTIPFDILSALFFLLSRYEEYYDHAPDKHGRYPATESYLFRKGLLERPLADEWIFGLYRLLREEYHLPVVLTPYQYQPTYDIDIAYSYLYKGLKRTAGALGKDLLKGNLDRVRQRVAVLSHKREDPYDCFEWLDQIHRSQGLKPVYFILSSLETTPFDKNIHPLHPRMQRLVKALAQTGTIGLHPSYFSFRKAVFEREKMVLGQLVNKRIEYSRQHYIKLTIPHTYYSLIEQGITDDWSMGFGSKSGFRAGTGRSFNWYDIGNERQTSLNIHPFCFMDSTAHFEERLNVTEAFAKLHNLKEVLQRTQSRLTTVFHNFSLGSDPQWAGWKYAYEDFLH